MNIRIIIDYLQGFLLRESIDVVRIFNLIEQVNNLFVGESHSQSDGSSSPRFAESIQYDDVWILFKFGPEILFA